MGDILSADEIQALLASYSSEGTAGSAATDPKPPTTARATAPGSKAPSLAPTVAMPRKSGIAVLARFEPPDSLSRGKRAVLEDALRRAADRAKSGLEPSLGSDLCCELGAFGLTDDCAPPESDSAPRFALRIEGESSPGEAAIDRMLASALVRSKFPGTAAGAGGIGDDRPLTEVELAILETEAATVVAWISEGIAPCLGAPLALGARKREPQEAPRESSLLWARFDFVWGEASGALWIGLPAKACRARLEGAAHDAKLTPPELAERWMTLLEPVRVPVAAVLGRARVTVEDLVGLEVGDVLWLDTATTDRLELQSGGCTIHAGRLGRHRGRWTFRVEKGAEKRTGTGGRS